MMDVDHLWGRWGNILVLILCINFSLFFDTFRFPIHQTGKKNWNLLASLCDLLIAKKLGCDSEKVFWLFGCVPFLPKPFYEGSCFFHKRYVDKITGKNREICRAHMGSWHVASLCTIYTSIPTPWWLHTFSNFYFYFLGLSFATFSSRNV